MKLKVTAIDKEFAQVSKKGQTYVCVQITGTNLYDGSPKTILIYPFKEAIYTASRQVEVGDLINIVYETKPNGSFPIEITKMVDDTTVTTAQTKAFKQASGTTTAIKDSKQDSIVFQSCLKVAVEFLNHNASKYTTAELIDVATTLATVARDINLDEAKTSTKEGLENVLEEYNQMMNQADDDDLDF